MRDVLVAYLCVMGALLVVDNRFAAVGRVLSISAAVLVIVAALLPVDPGQPDSPSTVSLVHTLAALVFFIVLAVISLFVFPTPRQSLSEHPAARHANRIYRICGLCIVAPICLYTVLCLQPEDTVAAVMPHNPVFWLETVSIVAFGVSWLRKARERQTDPGERPDDAL